MRLERVTLRQIRMPLVHFFETSFSRTYQRDIILVEVQAEGASGWGEVTAGENPFYNEEWTGSAWLILHDYLVPRVLGRDFEGVVAWRKLSQKQALLGSLSLKDGLRALLDRYGCSDQDSGLIIHNFAAKRGVLREHC